MLRLPSDSTLRHNIRVNLMDATFFGFSLGFGSWVGIIPLFVSTMTDSAFVVGLAPSIHSVGWLLPQILTINFVTRARLFRPIVLRNTLHERLPYIGLALAALSIPWFGTGFALAFTLFLLVWQGLGGGFTATAWQSMVSKLIPPGYRGTFFGVQASLANVLLAFGAVVSGMILERFNGSQGYVINFAIASVLMLISLYFLSLTREEPHTPANETPPSPWSEFGAIMRQDRPFRLFLLVRNTIQLAVMALSFYAVFAVRRFDASESTVGFLTACYSVAQIFSNAGLGYIGDRWGHPRALAIGGVAATLSATAALLAPNLLWLGVAFTLAGVANVAAWTTPLAMTLDFGPPEKRAAYIGISNTMTAPATLLAPLLGGLAADLFGYSLTFAISIGAGLLTLILVQNLHLKHKPIQGT